MSQLEVRAPDQEIATDHCPGAVEPPERGPEPEGTHRATVKDAAGQNFVRFAKKSQKRWIQQKFRDWRPIGRFMGSGGTGNGEHGSYARHQHECEPEPADSPPPEDAQAVHSGSELSTKEPQRQLRDRTMCPKAR